MNGVDYTKALSRERENYQKAVEKDREYNRKRLSDEEERHANIQKKQSDVYERDRSKMEAAHKERLSEIRENTAQLIDEKKGRYNNELDKERSRFESERNAQAREFDSRFRDIKDSYSRAFESERRGNQELQANQQERHKKSFEQVVKDRDTKVKEFQDRMVGSGANLKDTHNQERVEMSRNHAQQMDQIYRDEANKRFQLKEGLSKDLERTKATHAAEMEQYKGHVDAKVSNLAETYNADTGRIAADYASKNDKFVEAGRKENAQRNREHQSEVAEVRRGFDRDLRAMELEQRRLAGEGGEYADIAKRQEGLSHEQNLKNRINHLREQVTQNQQEYAERRGIDAEKTDEMFHHESVEAANRYERQGQRLTADKIVAVSKEKEKSNRLHQTQQATQHAERMRYESQILNERNSAGDKIEKLKESFSKSLKQLEENNLKYTEELRKQGNTDKDKFITQTQIQRNEEIHDLRRNFQQLMSSTTEDYEQKLGRMAQENGQLRDQLNNKVAAIQSDADNRIEAQVQHFADKRLADIKAAQEQQDKRESDLRAQIRELSGSYQRKMDQQQHNAEIRLKGTVDGYEAKLKEMSAQNAKALAEKEAMSQMEMKRMRSALDMEKAQIIAQYENRMNQDKIAYEQKFEQLKQYNRMG